MSVKIIKKEDGTFTVRVWAKSPDIFGRRKTLQQSKIKTFSAAKKLGQELEEIVNEETPNKDITFAELENRYLEKRSKKMSPETLANLKPIRDRVLKFWRNIPLSKINTIIAQQYVDSLIGKIKNGTIKRDMSHINAVINWGVGQDYLEYNKIKRLDYPEEKIFEPTLLSAEKIGEVLSFLKQYCYNIYIPVLLYATTGERRGEGLGIKKESVDFDKSILQIKNNMIQVNSSVIEKEKMKTRTSKRTIAMPEFVKKELEQHLKMNEGLEDEHICANIFIGKTPTPNYVSKKFHTIMKNQFGIEMRLHDLRHSFNQIAYEEDIDLSTRSKILGHASENITNNIYTHFSAIKSKSAINKITNKIESQFCSNK